MTGQGRQRSLRVLHCPANVGGHPGVLVKAERRLGLDSRLLVLSPSPFGYLGERPLTPSGAHPARVEAARLRLFGVAVAWADVVHLNFGSGIFPVDTAPTPSEDLHSGVARFVRLGYRGLRRSLSGRDLTLLRRLGKRIVVTVQGDDVRPTVGHPGGIEVDVDQDRRKRRLVAQFGATADAVFALNPDLLAHLPARSSFLPYANVDLASVRAVPADASGTFRVVHAPTHRSVKGTETVVAAVELVRSRGHSISLDIVEGVSRAEVLQRLSGADLAIDQLRVGWYGGFAVEAMSTGAPVIAYLAEKDLARVDAPFRRDIPIISSTPDQLGDSLERFVMLSDLERAAARHRARRFVERWHAPDHVAARCAAAYVAAPGSVSECSKDDR